MAITSEASIGERVPVNLRVFKIKASEIKPVAPGRGSCIATDLITVQGLKVGSPDHPSMAMMRCVGRFKKRLDSVWFVTSWRS
jgi:hypothetical protein